MVWNWDGMGWNYFLIERKSLQGEKSPQLPAFSP